MKNEKKLENYSFVIDIWNLLVNIHTSRLLYIIKVLYFVRIKQA
jgi:hypothetical protein